ncbi:HIG1 domain family member 2A, mitochondrial [Colletes gigas]|uniref:HIG1 domain family member 2A, mitochondrial n=1 Tax=Colletes gigas TaxID=935657 RepID=UPI001C9B73B7|nr:HIG1 domain family member 2A, mitochondrial [Colletes gigas]
MQENTKMDSNMLNELDWIRVRDEIHTNNVSETFTGRFKRKVGENPLVPLGCLATVSALMCGLYSFYNGNSQMSQYMMRVRVGAQAFTIFAMVTGFMVAASRNEEPMDRN